MANQGQERDEISSRVTALEMDRQRLLRRSKEVETVLSAALWSGKEGGTSLDIEEAVKHSYMVSE